MNEILQIIILKERFLKMKGITPTKLIMDIKSFEKIKYDENIYCFHNIGFKNDITICGFDVEIVETNDRLITFEFKEY